MPILIRNGSENAPVSAAEFAKEEDLELVLVGCPSLVVRDEEEATAPVKFVARQVKLEAGELDILLVDGTGLPIVVEVKLKKNGESRREVVAQAIDYISSLTELTVDELDRQVGGKLEAALRELAGTDVSKFDLLWNQVGANLRDGRARIIIAMDNAPDDLQRILRFLARLEIDVQLVTISHYLSSGAGDVFVPQILVSQHTVDALPCQRGTREPYQELIDVIDAYNASAPQEIRASGAAHDYRMVRPAGFPKGQELHYGFMRKPNSLEVQFTGVPKVPQVLASIAAGFEGKPLGAGSESLVWDKEYKGHGRLFARFDLATEPKKVAEAMRKLIDLTKESARAQIQAAGLSAAGTKQEAT
jgi:hypothetical protein